MSANIKKNSSAAKARRLLRWIRESQTANRVRKHPALALWCLVLVLVACRIQVWDGPPEGPEYVPSEQDQWVRLKAQDAIDRTLRVIGHGIRISSVEVRPLEPRTLARYGIAESNVQVAAEVVFSQDEMLDIAAHECVHAIFHQADLSGNLEAPGWESRALIQETTAYVLGAHIAGLVRDRQGGDGKAITTKYLDKYREACTWSYPKNPRRKIWERAIEIGVDQIDYWDAISVYIHYGSPELVDAIDRICKEHPDPWEAVHAVAEQYLKPSSS